MDARNGERQKPKKQEAEEGMFLDVKEAKVNVRDESYLNCQTRKERWAYRVTEPVLLIFTLALSCLSME